jgi:peptidoglycan glycosyltransferase
MSTAGASRRSPRPSAGQAAWLLLPPARTRLLALGAAAVLALVAGLVAGARFDPPERATVQAFADAWERGDLVGMYSRLTPAARQRAPVRRFIETYRRARDVLTLVAVETGRAAQPREDLVTVPVRLRTRIFGELTGRLEVPVGPLADGGVGVDWRRHLVFPGLHRGEFLHRETEMPPRAAIEARDGTPLAEGEARLSELGALAAEVAGRLGPAPPERTRDLERAGVPPGAPVGLTGLEREFDTELAGTPGGTLWAGRRRIAVVSPRPGRDVRTAIDPDLQRAAVTALAGRFGGIAVLRPRDGEVLALAGVAYSAPQPPGSTFKIITLTAALEAGIAKPSSSYPVQTAAVLEGVELENANGEACGGPLSVAFAESCNSVFAPLGARIGARRLVATAERFGFNRDPGLLGAARSTLPAAGEVGDDLAVGSTAIGQGKVLATPLLMAGVAAAIGQRGVRAEPTLRPGRPPRRHRVTSPAVARTVRRYMREVVASGTGVAAALPGVAVAGKTGTAELRDTTNDDPPPEDPAAPPPPPDVTDTDAWFVAFAPAKRPRVAVAVMLVGQGAGGDTAAPAARVVLETAVGRRG